MTDTLEVSNRKITVHYERKLDKGNYNNEVASVFVTGDVAPDANSAQVAEKANELFEAAKASVFDQLGIEFIVDEHGVLREKHAPVPTVQQAEASLGRAFGGTTPVNNGDIRVMNSDKQQGPLPDWLIEYCAQHGITAVWDNRNGKGKWFTEAVKSGERSKVDPSSARGVVINPPE